MPRVFSRKFLEQLIKKSTDPYVYKKKGYSVVTNGREESCASVMALSAVEGVLTNKRRADKVSLIDAKRQTLNGKKTKNA